MSDLRKQQEEFRENLSNGFDAVEDQELFCIGFDAFRDSPEYLEMKAALEFYAETENYDYLGAIKIMFRPQCRTTNNFDPRLDPGVLDHGKKASEVLAAIEGES